LKYFFCFGPVAMVALIGCVSESALKATSSMSVEEELAQVSQRLQMVRAQISKTGIDRGNAFQNSSPRAPLTDLQDEKNRLEARQAELETRGHH
jgi:hypothetical protein